MANEEINKIDDEALARDLIAGSPDVTAEIQEPSKEPPQKKNNSGKETAYTAPETNIDTDKAERDATMVTRGLTSSLKDFTGIGFNEDQAMMISGWAREGFELLQVSNLPRLIRFGIMGGVTALALLPAFIKLRGDKE